MKLHTAFPDKMFPIVITYPSQEKICEFVFTPIEGCVPLKEVVFGESVDAKVKDNVVHSMEILSCSSDTWCHLNTSSCSGIRLGSSETGFILPQFRQQQLLYLTLPMEEKVLGFSEMFENQHLAEFHLETFKTLKACCMHDNLEAGKEVCIIKSMILHLYMLQQSNRRFHAVLTPAGSRLVTIAFTVNWCINLNYSSTIVQSSLCLPWNH